MNLRSAGPPGRILIVRTSALGDIVHALPVLSALRATFPDARIGWVVDESFAALLDGHELLDEVLPVPLRRWRRSPTASRGRARELARFLGDLRRFRPDVALDLMGNHKGALIARASGAPRRIGARRADRREPTSALWINRPRRLAGEHAADRMFSLLEALGVPAGPLDFAPRALKCGRDRVPERGYIYLHPGAGWGNKQYPAERWGDAARQVARSTSLKIWVGAGPAEEELARRIETLSGGAARSFDAPSLADLVGVIRGARLVIAGDTGATHLARALEVPVLALHGPTDPRRHGPYRAHAAVIEQPLPCSYCHRRMESSKACLLGISADQIARRALEVLDAALD